MTKTASRKILRGVKCLKGQYNSALSGEVVNKKIHMVKQSEEEMTKKVTNESAVDVQILNRLQTRVMIAISFWSRLWCS